MSKGIVSQESGTTAVLVLGGIAAAAFAVWYYFNKKLQPVGGVEGATDAAGALSQISGGLNQLASPLKKLWADFMTPAGAGSATNPNDPKLQGGNGIFPTNQDGVPSWLGTTNAAVNTANGAVSIIRDAFKLGNSA